MRTRADPRVAEAAPAVSLVRRGAVFVGVFAALSALYSTLGAPVERFLIETVTVRPAAALLSVLAPGVGAQALGPRLTAPGGGVNVLAGCEGADLLFLLVAALAAAPLSWRDRAVGLAIGLAVALAANQARILALFFVAREWAPGFAVLHGVVAPLLAVLVVTAWFSAYLQRHASASVALYRL
ncbi:MAG: hypothetical protein RJA98_698 [Pseudomonadota bacterium]